MKKGEVIPKILEALQVQAEATVNLLDIFTSGYGESYRKMRRTIKYGTPQFKTDWASLYRDRQNFYSLLNQLKNDGLVRKIENKSKRGSTWQITRKGLAKLNLLRDSPVFKYKKELSDELIIVSFDVPEKERQKRDWLRAKLHLLDFNLLQESLWLGRTKIPEEFIHDLRERGMLEYVKIFEISKQGNIAKIF